MKWLEIIEIRITRKDHDLLESHLQQLMEHMLQEKKQQVKFFNKLNLETDFSIHLIHDSAVIRQNGSELGQHLVAVLIEFGLVNHSIWTEMKI